MSSPLNRQQLADQYFLENRARVLEVAAFLDRLDRAAPGGPEGDFRVDALRDALRILLEEEPGRARRVQLLLSDPTSEPRAAATTQGAAGAYDPRAEGR